MTGYRIAPNYETNPRRFKKCIHTCIVVLSLLVATINGQTTPAAQLASDLKPLGNFNNFERRNLATRSKSDFDSCRCDLTENSCDMFWCCDPDCNSAIIEKWTKTDFTCLYDGTENNILIADECYDRGVLAEIEDLQFGLRIYTNNIKSLLCILFTRDSNPEDFVEENFSITSSSEFNNAIQDAEDDFSIPLEYSDETAPTTYSLGDSLYLSDGTSFKMPLPNSFGLWEDVRTVKFFEDINSTTCARATTYDNCDTILDAQSYQGVTFNSGASSDISVTVGTIWIVTESDRSVSTSLTNLQTTTKSTSGTDCTCSKVLKELHYTAFTSDGSSITSVEVDVVYMDLSAATCTSSLVFDQIFSFTFKESQYSRGQSGSPGYLKGLPVLAGALSSTTENFIQANEDGFQLYGADETGTCLIDTSTIDPTAFYYTNPVLNFVDNAMYGCKRSYDLAGLQAFCEGTDQANLALFENLIDNLKYVGIYGNSNPHFISDWVEVEYESSSATSATFSGRTCTFDSAYTLRFYVTKFGTDTNPQYKISRVRLTPKRLVWTHQMPSTDDIQDFHALLSISFHEVPQSATEFLPKPPNKLPKLSRNVLYPFFIYDDAYSVASSLTLPLLVLLYFLIDA